METIKNAILMAAGKGARLEKYTQTTPKPLLPVNGKPFIEHLIEQLKSKCIENIYIIIGYKAKQFKYLQEKYNAHLIENDFYDKANNIMSMFFALNNFEFDLSATLIMDADQIINNIDIMQTSIDKSGYCCYYFNGLKQEWGLTLDKDQNILSCNTKCADEQYVLQSMSFWTSKDLKMLKTILTPQYCSYFRDKYWDNVALELNTKLFDLRGYTISEGDLIEVDTTEEYERILQNEKA